MNTCDTSVAFVIGGSGTGCRAGDVVGVVDLGPGYNPPSWFRDLSAGVFAGRAREPGLGAGHGSGAWERGLIGGEEGR